MRKILLLLAPLFIASCSYFNSSKDFELIPFKQKDNYGFFNLDGKIIINPQFSFASAFRENLALVRTTGDNQKFGFINKQGKYVINATYSQATVFNEGIAWVITENSAPTAINNKGETRFKINEAENVRLFSEGLAAYSVEDSTATLWGFVDKEGIRKINPQFTEVRNFSDGKCAVKNKEGKWGFIDTNGKIIINNQFDSTGDFANGKATVQFNEKVGVIDDNGKYVINPQFSNAYTDGKNFLIEQDKKYGWCDNDGKFIINPQFEDAGLFGNNDLSNIKSGDKYGYIDNEGKFMINPQFDLAYSFMGKVALVKIGDKWGLIDKKDKYIVNPQFDEIGSDLLYYINENGVNSVAAYVTTDYVDIESILKVVNINNPENLSFEDNFQTILNKLNKKLDNISTNSGDNNVIFSGKKINKNAKYGFSLLGRLKEYDYNSYSGYHVTNEKPYGFVYQITLSRTALGKVENIQKEFEKNIVGYNLMKKGYIDSAYTSVYKSSKNIVVTSGDGNSNISFFILKSDFDISSYVNKIVSTNGENSSGSNVIQDSDSYDNAVVDSAAAVVDSATTDYD